MSNEIKILKFIIAGGGTGGHIFPAIAIAQALKEQNKNSEFLFIGAKGKMEMEKVPQAGFNIVGIDIAGFNRTHLWKNIGLPFKLIKSYFQVKKAFKEFTPTAVIGVGGYSSFPVLRYAQSIGIPTFIHESNAFAGKSNQLLGKKATKIFVAAEGMDKFFPKQKISVVGNPVRSNISNSTADKEESLKFFNLQLNKLTILSVGGSLGAQSINNAIANGLQKINNEQLQLIWQTGKPFVQHAKELVKNMPNVWANDFIKEMDKAYSAADIIISRSGAMALTEICMSKKPAIFVPFPFAAEDHQTHNAQQLVNANAALMVKDNEAGSHLVSKVLELAKNEQQQKLMAKNIEQFIIKDADKKIAETILNIVS